MRLVPFFAAIPMGHVAGVYSAPKQHKTEVRFRLDEQGHNGTYTTNPGLPGLAAPEPLRRRRVKVSQSKSNQYRGCVNLINILRSLYKLPAMSTLQKKRRFPAAFGGLTDDWGGFGRISLEADLAQGHLQGAGGGLQGHLFLLPEFHDHMRIKKTKSARKNNKTAKARLRGPSHR